MEDELMWYVKLMNYMDNKALSGKLLNRTEINQLDICVERYSLANTSMELIHDIADANDCGVCNSWNDLIVALKELFNSGERIPIGKVV